MTKQPQHNLTHPAFALVAEYDALKTRLWQLEQEMNRECVNYAKTQGRAFYFPQHIRFIAQVMKEQSNG